MIAGAGTSSTAVEAAGTSDFEAFLAAKEGGADTQAAMQAIGFTGDERYAVTTEPLETRRHEQSWYQSDTVAAGK